MKVATAVRQRLSQRQLLPALAPKRLLKAALTIWMTIFRFKAMKPKAAILV
jgi:hypothetical protein